jgi:two-component sensor histidine kinase
LNEQVRRNLARFPEDFLFRLTNQEVRHLKSQFATSSWGGRRKLPFAFTEHGAIMAATIMNTPHAVEVSVYVVRAFVQLRAVLSTHAALAKKLEEVERKTEALALQHDTLAADTRAQFKEVIEALRALMRPPEPAKRPIGFVTPQEKRSS